MEAASPKTQNRHFGVEIGLAGATWEQSLSTEMQAVASRYKVMNDADQEQIKALRAKVASLQGAKP